MTRFFRFLLPLLFVGLQATLLAAPVEGFGARSKGGQDGRNLVVTRLDDDPRRPTKGSLRWALQQEGPRVVTFAVSGDVMLKGSVRVNEPFLTIDGSTAPDLGICIRGGSLEFVNTQNVILRHLRVRLGDENVRRRNKDKKRKRPADSEGLDCITLSDSRNILIDHCSLSWSCDELIGITRCREVTVQWCLLSEPLGEPKLHPYGNEHAFAINASASTLSIHHCLFSRFVMRGPQFECNDLERRDSYTVQMEAVNNVIFNYTHSGSRYTTGIEKGEGVSKGKDYQFQFLHNLYLNKDRTAPAIEDVTKLGHLSSVEIHASGNLQARTLGEEAVRIDFPDKLDEASRQQVKTKQLFAAPVPVTSEKAPEAAQLILAEAGCSRRRDAVDERVVSELRRGIQGKILKSQDEVGGWPPLNGSKPKPKGVLERVLGKQN
jgi:hypothetical protein